MRLPNSKNLFISNNKLKNYLISETHPIGRSKAKYFRALGFNDNNVNLLALAFKKIVLTNEVIESRKIPYGTNYVIYGAIQTPSGREVNIITIWFIEKNSRVPRFVTAYPV